jgi:hypothetical protein
VNGSRGCAGVLLVGARLDETGEMQPRALADANRSGHHDQAREHLVAGREQPRRRACETRLCRTAGPELIEEIRSDYWLAGDGLTPWAEIQSASGLMRSGWSAMTWS